MTTLPVRIACTLGDPNGIGPEVVFQALRDESLSVSQTFEFTLIGPESVLSDEFGGAAMSSGEAERGGHRIRLMGVDAGRRGQEPLFVRQPGQLMAQAGKIAMKAVEMGVDLCLAGDADGLVTAPISKEAVQRGGYEVPGHTEFLAERTRADHVTMMLVSGRLRVAVVTGHIPLARVPASLSQEFILEHLRTIHTGLRQDFGVSDPRIAVLGLNPHAGDGGVLGAEEDAIVSPAVRRACAESIDARGPLAADGFFGARGHDEVDCVLAMYHDQGLAPFKALSFGQGVNVTLGLPIVRTSPDHGTAFDIAGTGRARAGSFIEAIRTACQMVRARRATALTATRISDP